VDLAGGDSMNKKSNCVVHTAPHGVPALRKTLALMVSAVLGTAQAVQAQDLVLEEVIVTATKRKSNLQDLPQAITAFTTEDIVRQGFRGIDDYASKIPSLAFARREPGGTSVVFRGASSSGIQYGTNPSAGVYLDEQPITQAGLNPDPKLVDIERVEALSGPQGTLFGDASQSGTLRIITNKPDPGAFKGWVEGTVATIEDSSDLDGEVSGMVNLPLLQDKLAIRLVGFRSEEAGYIDNVLGQNQADIWESSRIASGLPVRDRFDNAGQVEDDINSSTVTGGRAALRWFVNEDWTVDVAGIVQKTETDGFGDVNLNVGEREQLRFNDEGLDDDWYQVSLSLEGRLGFADTLLTASYFNREFTYEADDTDYLHDFDQRYDPSYYAIYDFTGAPRATAVQTQDEDRWTIEGRLTTPSDSGSRWDGLVGFFYSKLKREQFFRADVENFSDTDYYANQGYSYLQYLANSPDYNPNYSTFHNQASNNFFFGVYDLEVEQVAVFGEATWRATERLSVTAGARWFEYDQDFTLQQGALLDSAPPVYERNYYTTDETVRAKDNDWVPKLNVTYEFNDDMLLYATYSEGFRRGGGNAVRATSILPRNYDPDLLKNYEAGFKSTWRDGALRFNAVAYYMDWQDMQIQVNDPTVFSLGIVNFSSADIEGFEFDFGWVPAAGWDITANMAFINAEIAEDNEILTPDGEVVAFVEKGTQLPITPEKKASVAVEYTFPGDWFGGEPYVRLDWSYVGDSLNSLNGTESIVFTQGPTRQSAYDIGNLRLGLETPHWDATLFIHNITDEVAEQFYNNRWGSQQRLSINKPRTIGATFRWKF
jgi:iron complex outermembrane recepter protein